MLACDGENSPNATWGSDSKSYVLWLGPSRTDFPFGGLLNAEPQC
jgi:hypothetical protein